MAEKILIKGEPFQTRKVLKKVAIWWTILVVAFMLLLPAVQGAVAYNEHIDDSYHNSFCGEDGCMYGGSVFGGIMDCYSDYFKDIWVMPVVILFFVGCGLLIIGVVALFLRNGEITVTDKRVYGIYGSKRVDLPIDSISAVSCDRHTVCVSSPSGFINFKMQKNADAVFEVINKLLWERQEQQKKETAPAPVATTAPTKAAELKEFKELLDSGIITQEEFDAKKKELLGL